LIRRIQCRVHPRNLSVRHLEENLAAADIELDDNTHERLNAAVG
jgi:pyridoxine 4-dehydrogenase